MVDEQRSYLTDLECSACGLRHDAARVQNLCLACGMPLLARYDLAALDGEAWMRRLQDRSASLWRYRELLPLLRPNDAVTLGESMTPILPLTRTGRRLGLERLLMKDEGLLPTGSFKARGAAVGVSRARELGVTHVALPTAGNAGGAWAAYAARAGLHSVVIMPHDAPTINVREAVVVGSDVRLVHGLISDAGAIVSRAVARSRDDARAGSERVTLFDASTLKEPYRIEGKKSMGFELAEQLGWSLPDVVLYPCGGGVGLIGMWKAFDELQAIGAIDARRPRFVAVQAERCAPIVRAWRHRADVSEFWDGADTVASGIRVPKALGDFLVLRALYETRGSAIAVSDAEIIRAIHQVGREEGLFLSPEGAATIAALPLLLEQGLVGQDERIVVFNTGSGLKYPETVSPDAPLMSPHDDI